MPETVFVAGSGGAIFEMDVPRAGTPAAERFDQAIAKGDLTVIPAAFWVDRGDGSKYLVAGTPEAPVEVPVVPVVPTGTTKRTKGATPAQAAAEPSVAPIES